MPEAASDAPRAASGRGLEERRGAEASSDEKAWGSGRGERRRALGRRSEGRNELLVLASYNIHRGVGRDGDQDLERCAAVLRELGADVIALQESESTHEPGRAPRELVALARAAGMSAIAGPTLFDHRFLYGNALLTRLPVSDVRRHDISRPGREARGVIDVRLEVKGGRSLRVVATHLGLRLHERRAQARRLSLLLARYERSPLALLGDLNEWRPLSRSLAPLERLFGRAPRPRSFPAHFPLLALDRVLVRPRAALLSLRAHRSALARAASDHLPVVARVDPELLHAEPGR